MTLKWIFLLFLAHRDPVQRRTKFLGHRDLSEEIEDEEDEEGGEDVDNGGDNGEVPEKRKLS